jgi:holliday junction DNA helicase RuvB
VTEATTEVSDERRIYVEDWDEFIGQDLAKEQLQIACASAKKRGKPLEHVLIKSGKPGIGKTTLAKLCAKELGTKLHMVSGKVTVTEARMVLSDMSDGDVLFYDEIHQAVVGGRASAEWMLHVLQDGMILGPMGEEEIPAITVIGATTDAGKLPRTIVGRFEYRPELVDYTDAQAALIAWNTSAVILGEAGLKPVTTDTAARIALAANNNPREISQLLKALRDIAFIRDGEGTYDEDFTKALRFLRRTDDGLDFTAQRYLVSLLTEFGGSAGERAIMNRLQEPGGLAYIEVVLMDKGLIGMTGRGRTLTKEGIRRAKDLRDLGVAA